MPYNIKERKFNIPSTDYLGAIEFTVDTNKSFLAVKWASSFTLSGRHHKVYSSRARLESCASQRRRRRRDLAARGGGGGRKAGTEAEAARGRDGDRGEGGGGWSKRWLVEEAGERRRGGLCDAIAATARAANRRPRRQHSTPLSLVFLVAAGSHFPLPPPVT